MGIASLTEVKSLARQKLIIFSRRASKSSDLAPLVSTI